MKRLVGVIAILLVALAAAGCASPELELERHMERATGSVLHEMHLRPIDVTPHSDREGLFNVVVPYGILGSSDAETGERLQEDADEIRVFQWGIMMVLLGNYKAEELDQQLHTLTFHVVHRETDDILIEVDFGPDLLASLDPDDAETYWAVAQQLPNVVNRYEDRFTQEHFDEMFSMGP